MLEVKLTVYTLIFLRRLIALITKSCCISYKYLVFQTTYLTFLHPICIKDINMFAIVDTVPTNFCNRQAYHRVLCWVLCSLIYIYINNVVDELDVRHLLYADDLKIFCEIKTAEDCLHLQENLSKLWNWSINNQLLLNKDKCFVKSFYRKLDPIIYDYAIDNSILERPDYIYDLGVTYDTKLKFDKHIEKIASSAYKSLGLVIRNSGAFQSKDILKPLYFAYVRSRLEYSSIIFSPIYQVHISALEKIQRRFLKFLGFLEDGTYPLRGIPNDILLRRFNLQSLSCRRMLPLLLC